MNDYEKRLSALRQENPFTSSSVGDPWEDKYPDVETINKNVYEGLRQLIRQKAKDTALPCAGLVFGEVGSGKTHLISRILKHGKQGKFPFSFAYIQPIEDPEQTYRYFLREVIANLCCPVDKSSDITQLDIILEENFKEAEKEPRLTRAKKINKFLYEFRQDPGQIFRKKTITRETFKDIRNFVKDAIEERKTRPSDETVKKSIYLMRAKFPDIPKEFLKVLFQYQVPAKRYAAAEWLKGVAIDEEDASLLKVADRLDDSPEQLEQKSRNILTYLGILLAYYKHPLVICFDRLENYDTDGKIRSIGKMIEFLVDNARAMLPVVFVRGQQWEEKLTKKFNQQVITRLKTNEFKLKGCDERQSLEIIETRLKSVFENTGEQDSFYPLDKDDLAGTFRTRLYSPRQVIMLANQKIRQILYPEKEPAKPVVPFDKLREAFESQCNMIGADFNRYQPDRSRLKRALDLYLNHSLSERGFTVESFIYPEDKFIDLECRVKTTSGESRTDVVFIIDIETNHTSVRASLSRGADFLEKNPEGKAVYIRDARCAIPPPPNWKATNETLERFNKLGGNVIFLDKEQITEWYALALLNYAVKEGDVTFVDTDNNTMSLSSEDMAVFIRDDIHKERRYSGFQGIGEVLK
ncbi:MAG: hypothetical protein GY749_24765 [Desulfobacteraceae bacterium]|nr:hypothetical protein [Desulfobacteraceae bacterium]